MYSATMKDFITIFVSVAVDAKNLFYEISVQKWKFEKKNYFTVNLHQNLRKSASLHVLWENNKYYRFNKHAH